MECGNDFNISQVHSLLDVALQQPMHFFWHLMSMTMSVRVIVSSVTVAMTMPSMLFLVIMVALIVMFVVVITFLVVSMAMSVTMIAIVALFPVAVRMAVIVASVVVAVAMSSMPLHFSKATLWFFGNLSSIGLLMFHSCFQHLVPCFVWFSLCINRRQGYQHPRVLLEWVPFHFSIPILVQFRKNRFVIHVQFDSSFKRLFVISHCADKSPKSASSFAFQRSTKGCADCHSITWTWLLSWIEKLHLLSPRCSSKSHFVFPFILHKALRKR
mmetsp:Transcript_16715/g.23239  ORF Transcript_16715/g.23239 Transcript_16715/m.23239 type:complete len:270 (-) Transcript_16715:677-1486(-)